MRTLFNSIIALILSLFHKPAVKTEEKSSVAAPTPFVPQGMVNLIIRRRPNINELRPNDKVLVHGRPGRPNRRPKEATFVEMSRQRPDMVVLLSGSGQRYRRRYTDVLSRA